MAMCNHSKINNTFSPADLAWLTAVMRSLSVVSRTLSPSSSSYYLRQKKMEINNIPKDKKR